MATTRIRTDTLGPFIRAGGYIVRPSGSRTAYATGTPVYAHHSGGSTRVSVRQTPGGPAEEWVTGGDGATYQRIDRAHRLGHIGESERDEFRAFLCLYNHRDDPAYQSHIRASFYDFNGPGYARYKRLIADLV